MASNIKTVSVLGGSGYIGKHCIYYLLKYTKSNVISISRSGNTNMSTYSDLTSDDLSRLSNFKCSALDKEKLKTPILKSDGVIHSIGTLLTLKDSSDENSYDTLSFKTAYVSSELIKENFDGKRKTNFVYISAERGLMFPLSILFGDYILVKRKTEKYLTHLDCLNTNILRAGVVCHPKLRSWSVPIYHTVNLFNSLETNILGNSIGEKIQIPSKGTMLDNLADFAAKGSIGKLDKTIYSANDMI